MDNRWVVMRYFFSESDFYDNTISKNSYSNIITPKEYLNRGHYKGQIYQRIDYDGVTRKYIIRDISEYSDHSEYPDCGYQRILMERIDE